MRIYIGNLKKKIICKSLVLLKKLIFQDMFSLKMTYLQGYSTDWDNQIRFKNLRCVSFQEKKSEIKILNIKKVTVNKKYFFHNIPYVGDLLNQINMFEKSPFQGHFPAKSAWKTFFRSLYQFFDINFGFYVKFWP